MHDTNLSQTWEISLLTPLHIGDGEEMRQDIDFVRGSRSLDVIDMELFFEALSDNPAAISEIGRTDFNLKRFARDYKITLPKTYSMSFGGGTIPTNIRRFIKDAHGRPFIPGSSLKGAVRTALQAEFDRSRLPRPTHYNSYAKAVKRLDGKDPHHDFLRPLIVSDSHGIAPNGALATEEIKFFNLMRGNRPGWKDFSSRRTLDRYEDASGIYVESLKPGTTLMVRVELDRFLGKDAVKRLAELPSCRALSGFDALANALNRHSLAIAKAEHDFFVQFKPETAYAAAAYQNIMEGIEAKMDKPGSPIFLRLAWGSGWRGMTGNWLEGEDLMAVRTSKNLGRKNVDIFPKTRRLALSGGLPCIPLGWVEIKALDGCRFFRQVPGDLEPPTKQPVRECADAKMMAPTKASTPSKIKSGNSQKTEIWENAHLKWTANDDMVTASDTLNNKKATIKGKEKVPEKYHKKLFKQKKSVVSTVTVEPYGNAFQILKIE